MTTLTVTSKGQVTLRKDVLQHLGVAAGEKLQVSKLPGGRVEVRAAAAGGRVEDIFGLFGAADRKPVSIEEMNRAIADAWAGKR